MGSGRGSGTRWIGGIKREAEMRKDATRRTANDIEASSQSRRNRRKQYAEGFRDGMRWESTHRGQKSNVPWYEKGGRWYNNGLAAGMTYAERYL
jgi:hypothetical protein